VDFAVRVERLRARDPEAVAWMFATFRHDVARCFGHRSPEDQADLVQDVFATAIVRLPTFGGDQEVVLRAWLRRIAFHRWHHRWEADRVRARHAGPGLDALLALNPNHPALVAEQTAPDALVLERRVVEGLLGRLTARQALVMRAHVLEGRTTAEIASQAGMTCEGVRGLYKRGLARLRGDATALRLLEAA